MEGRYEGLEPLDPAYDLSSLSGEVEAVGRGDRSMQQCPLGQVFREQWGRVLAVLIGLLGDSTSPRTPRRRPRDRR
jgi:hypothetical protein